MLTGADPRHRLRKTCGDGWWRSGNQLCKPAEVLRDGGECKLVLRPARTTQPKSPKFQDALEMGEQHLNALAITTRLLERSGAGKRSGDVARILMDAAGDLALG